MSKSNVDGLDLIGDGAAYIRVSSDQQDTQRQYDALQAFVKRHGVTIPKQHWFEDEGWARDAADTRPEFQRLLKLAESGQVRWIVVSERDRFGTADADEFIHYRYQLRKWGCRLYDTNGADWTRKDIATVITAVVDGEKSEKEQHDNSRRVLSGKAPKARDGEWQGGFVHLGIDVVCYDRATNVELYRVVQEGQQKRLKIYPDGRTERFDGKGVVYCSSPDTQVPRVAPSNDPTKIAAVETVFKRFATESISPGALARELNRLCFRTPGGGYFEGHHVRDMLGDPTYLGYYAWNRKRQGKFHRWTDDQIVPTVNRDEKVSENNKKDWVYSRRLFEPMIDLETWNAVQEKLEGPRRKIAPRDPGCYLSGLLHCGNCGDHMVVGGGRRPTRRNRPLRFGFVCSRYQDSLRRGQRNPDTCPRNGVYQDELEPYVARFLEETGQRLELLAGKPDGDHLTDRLDGQEDGAWKGFEDGVNRLISYLAQHHPEEYGAIIAEDEARRTEAEAFIRAAEAGEPLPAGTLLAAVGEQVLKEVAERIAKTPVQFDPLGTGGYRAFVERLLDCYRANFDPTAIEAELKELRQQHERLVDSWRDLPTQRAKDTATARLKVLDARLTELERQREDAAEVVERHYRQLKDLQTAIADARQAMYGKTGERAMRRKAEAIKRVIHHIDCYFEPTGRTGGGPGKRGTRLVKVTIYPVGLGDPRHFLEDSNNALRPTRATSPM
jgi:DNA invertase Pin-like site-specific DNA recombinase